MNKPIQLIDLFGKNLITREDGLRLAKMVILQYHNRLPITIDFTDVWLSTSSFLGEFVGRIMLECLPEYLNTSMTLLNMSPSTKSTLRVVIANNKAQSKDNT